MSERELAQLLRDVTPEPPVTIDFDKVALGARRRRRTAVGVAMAGVALVVAAAIGVQALISGGGQQRVLPVAPTAQPTSRAAVTPAPVLTAAEQLWSGVETPGPVSVTWVTMTWGQWKQLDKSSDAPTDASHVADRVYVVQLRSDTAMQCLICKGLTPVTGRFATTVLPLQPKKDTGEFAMGNDDFGLARRADVHTFSINDFRYTVAASLQTLPNGTTVLCGPVEAAAGGPAACGHTLVIGMPAKVDGSHTVDGYTRTPLLRLTGTWQHGVLTLVEPPVRDDRPEALPPLCGKGGAPHRADPAVSRRIANDLLTLRALGTDVYEITPCGAAIAVWVPVADATTKALFRSRYGSEVVLVGWLQPLR